MKKNKIFKIAAIILLVFAVIIGIEWFKVHSYMNSGSGSVIVKPAK